MAKEKIWFIESLKQKREDRKLSKELLELLQTWKCVHFEKYDKLPIKTAEELINHGYWEKVIENIDKFADNYSEVIDKLIDAKYDVLNLLVYALHIDSSFKYKLTDERILKLIWYKPGIICLFDHRGYSLWVTWIPTEWSSKEFRWKRWVLTDYEYYGAGAKISDIRNIHSKYMQMDDAQLNTQYYWKRYDENGPCLTKYWKPIIEMDTYWYHKLLRLKSNIIARLWL